MSEAVGDVAAPRCPRCGSEDVASVANPLAGLGFLALGILATVDATIVGWSWRGLASLHMALGASFVLMGLLGLGADLARRSDGKPTSGVWVEERVRCHACGERERPATDVRVVRWLLAVAVVGFAVTQGVPFLAR